MKEVKITTVDLDGTDRKGNAVFIASGTLDGDKFVARTIQYKGEPIFKLQEHGSHKGLKESKFSRGDRIAVARACKVARVEKFGEGHKARIKRELSPGQTVTLSASINEDANTASNDELIAAAQVLKRLTKKKYKGPKHSSGLPMHASISALKRSGA